MKLENQVTNLELSQKLKELGVKQESHWMWVKYEFWKEPKLWASDLATELKITCLSGKREYAYSAFTVAELGEMLPAELENNGIAVGLTIEKTHIGSESSPLYGNWGVVYFYQPTNSNKLHSTVEKNLADAMAKMKIYLLKEGY